MPPDEPYYSSHCPVCGEHASRADLGRRLAEFHCSRCGSFEIEISAIKTLSRKRLSHRLGWLQQVRSRNRSHTVLAMLDETFAVAGS